MKIDKSFIPITVYSSMIQFLILQKLYMIPINTEENTTAKQYANLYGKMAMGKNNTTKPHSYYIFQIT